MIEHEDLDKIETKYLREAIERSGLAYYEIAQNLGYYSNNKVDGDRLKKQVGYYKPSKVVDYDTAVKIVEACHFDPVDYGL